MEANFFRFAVEELYSKIKGLRIQKVFMPSSGIWTFSLGSLNLIFFHASRGGGFFLAREKPPNPSQPSAQVMWLRKRIRNQKIISCKNLWPRRKMVFELSLNREFLILDVREGVFIETEVQDYETPVIWPDLGEILLNESIWKTYPQITPPLRKAISKMSREKAQNLLNDLKQGIIQGFYLYKDSRGRTKPGCFLPEDSSEHQSYQSALEAAKAYGWPVVHEMITDVHGQTKAVNSEIKRLRKNLARIDMDRDRLKQMVKEAELGNLIKSNLHILDSGVRMNELLLRNDHGLELTIKLDPRQTILENMQTFFRKAAKGRRGLDFIEKREKELQKLIQNVSDHQSAEHTALREKSVPIDQGSNKGSKTEVRCFRSSDGFKILRARNRQAGHKLLSRQADPHDLWFHVQDGPGAHVILKRAHELVDVPQRSLEEAANLAALASYRKNDLKALIYCARVRDMRKIKGLEQGRVHVKKALKSILVNIDPKQESMLEINRS